MIDASQLASAIDIFNWSYSIEEFKMKLDLLNVSVDDFNCAYHCYIERLCPMLFSVLSGEDPHKQHSKFDIVKIGKFNNWSILLPNHLEFDGHILKIRTSTMTANSHTIGYLEEYNVDPLLYLCYSMAEALLKDKKR